jgi:hypothetical protein
MAGDIAREEYFEVGSKGRRGVTSEVVGDRGANQGQFYTLLMQPLLDIPLFEVADVDMTHFPTLVFGSTAFSAPTRSMMSRRCDLIEERIDWGQSTFQ